MAGRFIAPSEQYFDNSGNILAGGKLFFYDSGTVVAKNTFSDPGGTTANANPVILDGAGRTPDIYLTGSYKLIIKDSADVQIETRDPVLAADDTTKGFAVWNAVTVFSTLDIVRAANNLLYRSLADSNQNFEPSATAAKWSQVQFIGSYNANETYSTGDIVVDSTGNIYKSRVNSNTGNTPASSATQWATSIPAVFDALTANTINETTTNSGVTIEGVLVKDSGVFLGGTAAANKLDDYDNGTWTPTDASGAGLSLGSVLSTAVKFGKTMIITGRINYPSTSDTRSASFGGLPEVVGSTEGRRGGLTPSVDTSGLVGGISTTPGTATATFSNKTSGANLTNANLSGKAIIFFGIYQTD